MGMHWFSWRTLGACALLVSACSDDGVPLTSGATDGAATGTASDGGSGDSGPGTAVTTAEPTGPGTDSDPSGTSTASGTDTDSGTGSPGSSSDGTAGSTGGSSSTGGTTEPECVMDEDCMLVDDCCTCDAIAVGDEPPKCEMMECLVSTCTSLGLEVPAVQCNFGTCEVEEVSCDEQNVTCDGPDAIPPKCPEGQAPRVVDGCWSGCIPVEYCDVVPGCESCGEDEACIESVTQVGPSFTCVPIPPSCEGMPSCDCLGEACEEPFDTCNDGIEPKSGSELSCSCPAC